ncbi:hypothetical protein [Methyloversatilis universalis]|uniref:hypothetical protein n=1 Tax=Methyloversatilis universalis TaxID=378211 RepID=UPI00036DF149|nr:hypothetical protein [Methyloversatilis universalis]
MIQRRRHPPTPQHPDGVWEYLDQDEGCFLFELWSCEEISLESIDDFIESEALPEWVRDDLLAMRTDALAAYRAKGYELALARASALQWACRFYGQNIAAAPEVILARKFKGRKKGSEGPVKTAVRKLLKKNPKMKNAKIWESLQNALPRGWLVCENRAGKYIEGKTAGQGCNYPRFQVICSEVRATLDDKNLRNSEP